MEKAIQKINLIFNTSIILAVVSAILFFALSCEDVAFRIGKSKNQIKTELAYSAFKADSLLLLIKMNIDSLYAQN
tara:strand:- start:1331 stop:1555 length:225 start_codon:yes stop_codon:yes gene_type:complete